MRKIIKGSSIVIDKQELKRRYNEYNNLYFGGRLGKCSLSYNYITPFGRYIYDQKARSTIIISKNVRWTDKALGDVLVHEMVHMYLRTVLHIRLDGLFGHGPVFRLVSRNQINFQLFAGKIAIICTKWFKTHVPLSLLPVRK